jgi:hypothetical protein
MYFASFWPQEGSPTNEITFCADLFHLIEEVCGNTLAFMVVGRGANRHEVGLLM